MINSRDYIQENHISISHWGMFPIEIPEFSMTVEDDTDMRQAVREDFFFRLPFVLNGMKNFKNEIAAFANKLV